MFEKLGCIQDTCFVETAKGTIVHLLNFVEEIAISHRSPERLFRIINMYESLSDLLTVIKSIVLGKYCTCIRAKADGILTRLVEAAKSGHLLNLKIRFLEILNSGRSFTSILKRNCFQHPDEPWRRFNMTVGQFKRARFPAPISQSAELFLLAECEDHSANNISECGYL
jgi:hypothetical protein